uniref:Uncharacterized protein n=1 Tax=Anguilla anguilla TaxID=7936 RepID=A0A0E9SES0_ANGAN
MSLRLQMELGNETHRIKGGFDQNWHPSN